MFFQALNADLPDFTAFFTSSSVALDNLANTFPVAGFKVLKVFFGVVNLPLIKWPKLFFDLASQVKTFSVDSGEGPYRKFSLSVVLLSWFMLNLSNNRMSIFRRIGPRNKMV